MTDSAWDPPGWQVHIPNKPRREALANRFRDAAGIGGRMKGLSALLST